MVGLESSETCIGTIQMYETHAAYGAVTIFSHLKLIENWLLSMYIDAGLYIWVHINSGD